MVSAFTSHQEGSGFNSCVGVRVFWRYNGCLSRSVEFKSFCRSGSNEKTIHAWLRTTNNRCSSLVCSHSSWLSLHRNSTSTLFIGIKMSSSSTNTSSHVCRHSSDMAWLTPCGIRRSGFFFFFFFFFFLFCLGQRRSEGTRPRNPLCSWQVLHVSVQLQQQRGG